MAANSICRAEIHAVDGVEFLARMLETKAVDEGVLTPAELAAAERVQKKAAIALSRLVGIFIIDQIHFSFLLGIRQLSILVLESAAI